MSNIPVSIRLATGVIDRIDKEIEDYREHCNRSDFVVDAVKFYLSYRMDQRNKESESKKSENQVVGSDAVYNSTKTEGRT